MTEDLTLTYFDTETSVKCPIGNNKANPMWMPNKIVASAYMIEADSAPGSWTTPSTGGITGCYIVGHNIKFDLLYIYRNTNATLPPIWCTQLAEYILSGQQVKYATLNSLIIKYVGAHAVKDDRLKEWWDAGKDTEDIPTSILHPYLFNDVEVLQPIFKAQWKAAEEQGCLPLMLSQMDALRATTCMNLVGMKVYGEYIKKQILVYNNLIEINLLKLPGELRANDAWQSPKQLSLFFFGGMVKKKVREQDGFYKNGKPKYVTKEVDEYVSGLYPTFPAEQGMDKGKSGYYSVDDDVLSALDKKYGSMSASSISKLRQYNKYISTYYQGIQDLTFPNGFIYPQLNHVSTGTGRLSCTQPNLQNQTTDGGVKGVFISRWGNDGSLLEVDYSQLEIVWLAYLSGDKQLIKDINTGTDIHIALYQEMYHKLPTKEERKAFKPRSFQLIYGAGAISMAQQGGITVAEAKKFIKVFYGRYPGVKEWHDKLLQEAKDKGEVFYKEGEVGPFHRYTKVMPWGRKYVHQSYDNEWSKDRTFSPTELKNYPVQGSATGDMVPLMLGVLQRKMEEAGYWEQQTAFLINTVHDSILLDTHKDVTYNVAKLVKQVLEDAPHYLKEMLGIDFPCKLKVGVEIGSNWLEMKEITI